MTIKLSAGKEAGIRALSNADGIIDALAIDQRGSLKKMIAAASSNDINDHEIVDFKAAVSAELTPYTTSILLDPEYGLPAAKARAKGAGLLLAYEKTGYDVTEAGRLPDILGDWSVRRLKAAGADAIKFLLYYDVDEDAEINNRKQAFIERLGSEIADEDLPFFLELVTYDANIDDVNGAEYAKVKPHKVIEATREFSKPKYQIDVLKLEVPVNQKFVDGFNGDGPVVYGREEALEAYQAQNDATELPFIFLSAGVSAKLFEQELAFARTAGSTFNGVLCGRATWRDGVQPFAAEGEDAGRQWLQKQGKANLDEINEAVFANASSWFSKYDLHA